MPDSKVVVIALLLVAVALVFIAYRWHAKSFVPKLRKVEDGLKPIAPNRLQVTKPTPVQIGKPAQPIPDDVLVAMRKVVAGSGAKRVYWFWMSIAGNQPHLGLAVAPTDLAIFDRIGKRVEPIWRKHRPDNAVFDILPLDASPLSETIRKQGSLLYDADNK